VRGLVILALVGGCFAALITEQLLAIPAGIGAFLNGWTAALLLDGVLVQARLTASRYARHAAEMDRIANRHREQDARAKGPDELDPALDEIRKVR